MAASKSWKNSEGEKEAEFPWDLAEKTAEEQASVEFATVKPATANQEPLALLGLIAGGGTSLAQGHRTTDGPEYE